MMDGPKDQVALPVATNIKAILKILIGLCSKYQVICLKGNETTLNNSIVGTKESLPAC